MGFAYGVSGTIFNLYLLALGYTNAFLGGILSISAFSLAFSALAAGPICVRIGAKRATILGVVIMVFTAICRVALPVPEVLILGAIVDGVGFSLTWVAYSPFLTENSTPYERTHLFGSTQALNILSSFLGNTLAGSIPLWIALIFVLPIDSALAFQLALIAWIIPLMVAVFPLILIRDRNRFPRPTNGNEEDRDIRADLKPGQKERRGSLWLVVGFAIVSAIVGFGAGFIVPFLNVFFWDFYNLSTPIVGLIQGLGSASVALGVFLAPILSTRIGKVHAVVIVQAFSLPFLVVLAIIVNPLIASASFIFRQVLMTAGIPIDSTLQMELMPESWRMHLSAIITFALNITWAISVQLTGQLYDLGLYLLPFWFTLICYTVGTVLYGVFFYKPEKQLILEQNDSSK